MLRRTGIYIVIFSFFCFTGFSQEIRLENKLHPEKSKIIRLDKPLTVKTFQGLKQKGAISDFDSVKLVMEGQNILLDDIMMISGYVVRNAKEKAIGTGLAIGAGIIMIPAVYYILGGIAWGIPNGIFVGATVMVFDLLLAYVGTNLMGIYPRRFSTMNWNIHVSGSIPAIPLPQPSD